MALVIRGKTRCGLCCKILGQSEAVVAFPAFLSKEHPLSTYSDAAFHENCFRRSSDAQQLVQLYEAYQEIWANRPTDLSTREEFER